MLVDLLMLNGILILFRMWSPTLQTWSVGRTETLWVVCNLAMALSMWKFSTIIHLRMVSGGDILRKVFELTVTQTLIAYLIMKLIEVNRPIGWMLVDLGICQMLVMTVLRVLERLAIKQFRQLGMNTRTVTFVGDDSELSTLYTMLKGNPTLGYRVVGLYTNANPIAEQDEKDNKIPVFGTVSDLIEAVEREEPLTLGDELYVCLSRREREKVKILSDYCDRHVIRFYYVPISVEQLGMRLKRELYEDMELFTTYEVPLEYPMHKSIKRLFDLVMSLIVLIVGIPLLPIVALIIKIQSPGPVFFRQERTGYNGRNFLCYKFRSMRVNKDADKLQATENDPRKFPFGNFMRKYNIDELPQFWNVFKGDMSVVGPRPHMLYHTEKYSQLIERYMVRHFVKPGITGWAQVTGYRGETRELWQMEKRVKQDIWYIENWTIWLDLRIIWMTFRTMVVHDKKAY
jgi:putative colanic acid biosynthesis UDP-glucose lipid carrier transferase